MAGFFKQLDRHRRRLPKELEQYDDEYLRYCVEKDLVETVLESTLHETDDPKEISDVCRFRQAPQQHGERLVLPQAIETHSSSL